MKKWTLIALVLALTLLSASSLVWAEEPADITLDFSTLPSAQGWEYSIDPGIEEARVYSVSGGILYQNTMGIGGLAPRYNMWDVVDPQLPFTISLRARVLEEENTHPDNHYGFSFGAFAGPVETGPVEMGPVEKCTVGIGPNHITLNGVFRPRDNTQFHDYRLEGVPGVSCSLFVDDVLVDSSPPQPDSFRNSIYLGDGTRGSNARAEVTSYIFNQNDPPVIVADQANVAVDEGQTASNTGIVSDLDGDTVALTASVGIAINNGNGTWSWSFATSDGPTESRTVTIYANDANGGTAQTSFALTVNNVPPSVDSITAPLDPVAISDQPVSANANFSDPANVNDEPNTCTVSYGEGASPPDKPGTVTGTTCSGPDHTYAEPGVYQVSVTVTDKDGGSGSAEATEFIVVYDSEGGFVTGGGWIDSSEGAYVADPTLTGKATFGFVSKYKKGAEVPTGETEFQFHVANLNFHSDSYEWLVVAGHQAKYKGVGTINGTGNYGFMISAIDEKLTPSTDLDLFRIKIWDKATGDIVYDNQMGADDDADPATAIGGGNIVIHK